MLDMQSFADPLEGMQVDLADASHKGSLRTQRTKCTWHDRCNSTRPSSSIEIRSFKHALFRNPRTEPVQ